MSYVMIIIITILALEHSPVASSSSMHIQYLYIMKNVYSD